MPPSPPKPSRSAHPSLGETLQKVLAAGTRMPRATVAGLLAAWTAVILALWEAVFGALGAVIVLILHQSGDVLSFALFNVHTAGGLTFLTFFSTFAAGAAAGFVFAYTGTFAGHEAEVAATLFIGIIIAVVFAVVATYFEGRLLQLRGYRRPSAREMERIEGPMNDIFDAIQPGSTWKPGAPNSPLVLVADTSIPQAWTHAETIVITTALLNKMEHAEFRAVLAHEVMHWRRGDGLALRVVWATCWPLAMLFNLGHLLSGGGAKFGPDATEMQAQGREVVKRMGPTLVAAIGWLFLWPTALLTRWVIAPLAASEMRRLEYEADAGVAAIGLGDSLVRALEQLSAFESGRTAWEAALTRTHPPIAFRIEHLEAIGSATELPTLSPDTSKEAAFGVTVAAIVLILVAIAPFANRVLPKAIDPFHHSAATATPSTPSTIPPSSPDTPTAALNDAANFSTALFENVFNVTDYTSVIDDDAAPGVAPTLVAAANNAFKQGAQAVTGDTVNNTATVLAYSVVSLNSRTHPKNVTVSTWVRLDYTVNGGTQQQTWATATYTMSFDSGTWRVSAMPPASTGPTPSQLGGASLPSGFHAYPLT